MGGHPCRCYDKSNSLWLNLVSGYIYAYKLWKFQLVYYLATKAFSNTIRSFLATWGKSLKSRVRVVNYHKAFRQKQLPPGTYIFSDLERLSVCETEWAASIYHAISNHWGSHSKLLNHPIRSMRRYELLRALYNRGINSHNVFRITEGRLPKRYPVFIRGADDHGGAGTDLIHSEPDLMLEIDKLNQQGISREDKIIVEFCDTSDEQGVFRKYSAFIVGDKIIPRHICFSRDWQIKYPDLSNPEFIEEEYEFVTRTAHEASLKKIFAIAGITYGRIDYGIRDNTIQVWEINTNPRLASFVSAEIPARQTIHDIFVERINRAFETLDNDGQAMTGNVKNPLRNQLVIESVLAHAKHLGESVVFMLPFSSKVKGAMRSKLVAIKNRIQDFQ